MGISGLIPFLEKASSRKHIKDFQNSTVAVDAYCWLHKGAIACAEKLSRGEDTNVHILYCLKYVNLLLSYNIKPILVFDGRHLPAKALTERRRRESRLESKRRVVELLRKGDVQEARSHMKRCIDITHAMALQLIQKCREMDVDCIVAPYEADAQLAYFSKEGIADYIITEDSDLVLFGSKKIIFKLDVNFGNCLLIESDKLYLAMGCRLEKYSFDKFCNMCILSGCDYLDSLKGIGLGKSCKFFLLTEETDMRKALMKLPQYLKMPKLEVTPEYIENFYIAQATFKYMFVYDPLKRQMVRLNDPDAEGISTNSKYLCNAGELLDNDTAYHLALGNLDPFTLKKMDDFNPDNWKTNTEKPVSSKTRKHKSIWNSSCSNYFKTIESRSNKIETPFFKKLKILEDPKFIESSEVVNENKSEEDIILQYTKVEPPTKRSRLEQNSENEYDYHSEVEINELTSPIKSHNPFSKTPESKTASVIKSLLNSLTSPKKGNLNIEVRSRHFSSNKILVSQNTNHEPLKATQPDADKQEVTQKQNYVPLDDSARKSFENFNNNVECLYEALENHENPVFGSSATEDNKDNGNDDNSGHELENINSTRSNSTGEPKIIDLTDPTKSDIKPQQKMIIRHKSRVQRVGLSKKFTNTATSQPSLSMFGFKKSQCK